MYAQPLLKIIPMFAKTMYHPPPTKGLEFICQNRVAPKLKFGYIRTIQNWFRGWGRVVFKGRDVSNPFYFELHPGLIISCPILKTSLKTKRTQERMYQSLSSLFSSFVIGCMENKLKVPHIRWKPNPHHWLVEVEETQTCYNLSTQSALPVMTGTVIKHVRCKVKTQL